MAYNGRGATLITAITTDILVDQGWTAACSMKCIAPHCGAICAVLLIVSCYSQAMCSKWFTLHSTIRVKWPQGQTCILKGVMLICCAVFLLQKQLTHNHSSLNSSVSYMNRQHWPTTTCTVMRNHQASSTERRETHDTLSCTICTASTQVLLLCLMSKLHS